MNVMIVFRSISAKEISIDVEMNANETQPAGVVRRTGYQVIIARPRFINKFIET